MDGLGVSPSRNGRVDELDVRPLAVDVADDDEATATVIKSSGLLVMCAIISKSPTQTIKKCKIKNNNKTK